MKTQHTPTPWHSSKDGQNLFIAGDDGRIAEVFYGRYTTYRQFPIQEANAAFIVRCCNSFDYALELLNEATMELKDHAFKARIESFLKENIKE